jgi:serine/threonine-protein kinase
MKGSMSRERWRALEPLLDAALDLEPAERARFLDEACGADAAMRADLEALIADCERGDALLASPAAAAYAPLLVGSTPVLPPVLGDRYRIVREVGRGGMATVYLADDPKHGRQVAVKVLHAEVARLVGHGRFLREIEIAARLSHPHILPLHDSGEATGEGRDGRSLRGEESLLYYVSPFVRGESLRDRLRRERRLPPDEAVRLAREVAGALDYAHRQGVIHLDIKPENILLQEGHAIVADFGIARAITGATEEGSTGVRPLPGTPAYMSPEQAAGATAVDGRSDIYSLGCVLHEMLTGERPVPSPFPPPVRSPHAVSPAPSPAAGPAVTPTLAAIIARATAQLPRDRFATAEEMAQALGGAEAPAPVLEGRPGRWRTGRRRVALIAAGVAAAAAAAALVLRPDRRPAELDDNLIAIAPFDAADSELAIWREGLVDVLSRNLDGAGQLRAVPPSLVVRHWQGRADAAGARTLAERTGAGLTLHGGLLAAGDSVRATAVLLDARTGRPLAEIERRELASRMDRLADSLTVAALRELGRTRRIEAATAPPSPSVSIAALKEYLQGEQFYRRALWDSAEVHFARALAHDSTLALAYLRLAAVRRWSDPNELLDSTTFVLMRQASRHPRGLAPRERILATVDSLKAATYFAALQVEREETSLAGKLLATLQDAVRQYPRDPELHFLLALARYDYEPAAYPREPDERAILEAFDRAIALDSTFAPAYVTPISLAAYLYGADSARRYIRAYLALEPSGPNAQVIRLTELLLDPRRARDLDVARLIDTLPPDRLCAAMAALRHLPDSAETAVRIAHALADRHPKSSMGELGEPSSPTVTCSFIRAVDALQFRGHLREALGIASSHSHWLGPVVRYNLARFGMVPIDSSRAAFARILSLAPRTTMTKLYGWWATDGDTASIGVYLRYFESAPRGRTPTQTARRRSFITAGHAYLALARRDTAEALRQFLALGDPGSECWYDVRLTVAQLLVSTGRFDEAATWLDRRWPGTTKCSNGIDDVLWTFLRARTFERLGRRAEAVDQYAYVVDAWRTADPELQDYVREARAGLARLR